MTETGFLEAKSIRPGSAAMVALLHGAAITALLTAKGYVPAPEIFTRTRVTSIELVEPPPPEPPREPQQRQQQRTEWTPTPLPPFRNPTAPTLPERPPAPPPDLGSQASDRDVRGTTEPVPDPRPAPPPPPPAVRRDAVMIAGNLQPPYPTSEQRAEREGTVVIRVLVGADGRVKSAEKVRATSAAFYEATERHARTRWRFRPATVDGQAVEARKTLTVEFRLDGG